METLAVGNRLSRSCGGAKQAGRVGVHRTVCGIIVLGRECGQHVRRERWIRPVAFNADWWWRAGYQTSVYLWQCHKCARWNVWLSHRAVVTIPVRSDGASTNRRMHPTEWCYYHYQRVSLTNSYIGRGTILISFIDGFHRRRYQIDRAIRGVVMALYPDVDTCLTHDALRVGPKLGNADVGVLAGDVIYRSRDRSLYICTVILVRACVFVLCGALARG